MKKTLLLLSLIFTTLLPLSIMATESLFDNSDIFLSNEDEFLKVDEAFIFDFHQQDKKLTVSFNIKDGYYLYQHQFKFTPENADISPVQLPKGIEHNDEYFGIQEIFPSSIEIPIEVNATGDNPSLVIRYQGCAKKGLCYPPTTKTIPLDPVNNANNATNNDVLADLTTTSVANDQPENKQSEQFELADMLAGDSLFLTLIAFFLGGLLLSFTPCVFPMYPILTGIIVGQGDKLSTKRAFSLSFFYVQGMAITYTILGIVVALAGAQFQAMFQHPAVLIVLSVLFIFLALSMFGLFNLALPSSWQNKLNNISNNQKGGSYGGVIAMGAISGLVASPCTTAPLTGALIFIADSGDILTGASALYALSLGMGLPLLVLGSSGGKILPKAGNWMNIIKNIFGLLLLAVPVFLLERFIPAAATQALWALLALAAGSYFYVANQQSSNKNFAYGLRFALIFIMLFFGANKLYQTVFPSPVIQQHSTQHQSFIKVNNLTELNQAIATANAEGKTVMLDLYADWCIACKEFEELTFPKENVQNALSNTVLLQIDLTDTGSQTSIEIMEHFDVFGLPSILFFDLSGNELTQMRVTGFKDAEQFTAHITQFL
ncbi:protein-disulfide reductase DsbD [Thalassotalea agariperforans]